jgi:hypothetical protein
MEHKNNNDTRRRKVRQNKKTKLVNSGRTWNTLSQHMPERISRGVDNVPYKIVQSVQGTGVWSTSTSLQTFYSPSMNISSLDQISSLAAVFDQYMVELIEFWLLPTTVATTSGEIASVLDFDDSTALTTFAQAEDYQNCLIDKATGGHYRKFKPHVAVAAYGGGAFTSYSNVECPWIDCSSLTVQQFGIKFAATLTSAVVISDIVIRYHIAFRNVR